ncbi:MAG: DUF2147 domain-containing protein [Gammaproteobacteria bacterium]
MSYLKSLFGFFLTLTCLILTSLTHASDRNIPVGYWETIDDVTGKPKSILEIWEAPDHSLQGRLAKIYPDPGHNVHERCVACTGENHNKPFLGLMIMWNFKFDGKKWEDGRILDPRSGKIYHCNMKMAENGKHLHVHGYIGIPLFGRTQTWNKVSGI